MRELALALVLLGALLLPAVGPAVADSTPSTPADELATVNGFFVESYSRATREVRARAPAAILVLPGGLVLHRGGDRQEWPLRAPLFTELKTIAHIPVGLFSILDPTNGASFAAADRAALERYRDLIPQARAAIERIDLTPAQEAHQGLILEASQAFIERALGDGRVAPADLTAFCRRMRPSIDANIEDSTRAYLDALNQQMGLALAQLEPKERESYVVIVGGVRQARMDNAAMQYFDRLMNDPAPISQRLMDAENIFEEPGMLRMLGFHTMASRVGVAFFDDPDHMNRDVLAQAAHAYIPTLQLPTSGPDR